jgi:hypothetical protein
MSRRERLLAYGFCGVLALAGVLVLALISGIGAEATGAGLIGVAGVLAVGLVFYEVGLSEDRERAREEEARLRRERPQRASAPRPRRPRWPRRPG